MKKIRNIFIAIATVLSAECVLYGVLVTNLSNGMYPADADSIGIPLIESVVPASITLILLVGGVMFGVSNKWCRYIGAVLFLLAASVSGLFAASWAYPGHYLVALAFAILSIGSISSGVLNIYQKASKNV